MEEDGWVHCAEHLPPRNEAVIVLWKDCDGHWDTEIMVLDESSSDEEAWWCFPPTEV